MPTIKVKVKLVWKGLVVLHDRNDSWQEADVPPWCAYTSCAGTMGVISFYACDLGPNFYVSPDQRFAILCR